MCALRSFIIIVIIDNIIIVIGILMIVIFRCQAEDCGLPPASHSDGLAAGTGSTSSVNRVNIIFFLIHPRSHRWTLFLHSFVYRLYFLIEQSDNTSSSHLAATKRVPSIPCFSSFILVHPCSLPVPPFSSLFIPIHPHPLFQQQSETRACCTSTSLQVRARQRTPSGVPSSRRASRCGLMR